MGPLFENHTQKIAVKNHILYVKLDSASLKQELSYVKEGLVLKINKQFGKKVINKIVIR